MAYYTDRIENGLCHAQPTFPHVPLHGAATGRIQWHDARVIAEAESLMAVAVIV